MFHCYLTWQGDPSTTVTVNFHTACPGHQSRVRFDTEPRGGVVEAYGLQSVGASHRVPGLRLFPGADRTIHVVELTGLTPGQTYYFVAGDEETGYSDERKFRTLPLDGPLRFITGGDLGTEAVVGDLHPRRAGMAAVTVGAGALAVVVDLMAAQAQGWSGGCAGGADGQAQQENQKGSTKDQFSPRKNMAISVRAKIPKKVVRPRAVARR